MEPEHVPAAFGPAAVLVVVPAPGTAPAPAFALTARPDGLLVVVLDAVAPLWAEVPDPWFGPALVGVSAEAAVLAPTSWVLRAEWCAGCTGAGLLSSASR